MFAGNISWHFWLLGASWSADLANTTDTPKSILILSQSDANYTDTTANWHVPHQFVWTYGIPSVGGQSQC